MFSMIFKATLSSHVRMITNQGSSKKPAVFYLDARNPTGINLTGLARKFDLEKGETASTAFEKLNELSERLCAELNLKYPRVNHGEKPGLPDVENLCWAASLILTCWLGLTSESNSVKYREVHADEHLYFEIIPSVLNAFKQGIQLVTSGKRNRPAS